MSNETLISIILALIAAHYVSLVWEIRKVRNDISALKDKVSDAALAASQAATLAASIAQGRK